MVHAAIETSRPGIVERDLQLTVTHLPESVIVDADPTRLAQVFGNLLNNAAKFSDVRATSRCRSSARTVMSSYAFATTVSASPPAMQPKIFDLFSQLQPSLEQRPGRIGHRVWRSSNGWCEMHGGSVIRRARRRQGERVRRATSGRRHGPGNAEAR